MTISAERLAKVFVEVADTLVAEFDVIEFLQMLADRAAGVVDAAAVGLLVADQHGRLQFMAASDENTRLLELFQVQSHDGPCLDAFNTAQPVINVDLRSAGGRWPRFAPQATASGFRSVHAFPLRLRDDVIGAMNIFGRDVGGLDESDAQIAQALADVAAIGLLQERAITRGEILTEQLQGALNSRIVIEQAKGAVAQAHDVTVEAAFELIRAHARRTNRRLHDVARLIVTDARTLSGLVPPLPVWARVRSRRGHEPRVADGGYRNTGRAAASAGRPSRAVPGPVTGGPARSASQCAPRPVASPVPRLPAGWRRQGHVRGPVGSRLAVVGCRLPHRVGPRECSPARGVSCVSSYPDVRDAKGRVLRSSRPPPL
jgi:hypothetical protein